MAKKAAEYADFVTGDLLGGLEGVVAKRMFGGHGVYLNGVIFGLIADDVLYFKADETTRADYERLGSKPFSYESSKGAKVVMSYWEVPADVLEDRWTLEEWAKKSAAVSAASGKTTKRRAHGKRRA